MPEWFDHQQKCWYHYRRTTITAVHDHGSRVSSVDWHGATTDIGG
jgi:hypothetical protein